MGRRPVHGDTQGSDVSAAQVPTLARQVGWTVVRTSVLFAVTAASIAFALQVTPERSVSTLGQTIAVGTAPRLSAGGPGEVVLFGRPLPTQVEFVGPVRPRLVLTDITLDRQLVAAFSGDAPEDVARLGDALTDAWRRYLLWETAFAALAAVTLFGAIAGWRGHRGKRAAKGMLGGVAFVMVVNLAAVLFTLASVPDALAGVGSLSELVGREAPRTLPAAEGPTLQAVEAVVLGDSVAAGIGGPPLPDPSAADEACQRTSIAFADILARVNRWDVVNLGCSGATIEKGVLGRQYAGGRWLPPQLAAAKRVVNPEVVIVNVGANDLYWSVLVRLCAFADVCDDRAQTTFFQRSLDGFTSDYYELLGQLGTLRGDPTILINGYYAPFEADQVECIEEVGLTQDKVEVLLDRLDVLNTVLANGAETFGYRWVLPDFSGHGVCSAQSYVQGMREPAPLHPNARGQLMIALDDERVLLSEL